MHSRIAGISFRYDNIPWDKLQVGDPLVVLADPCGATTGETHDDPNALALYWPPQHINEDWKDKPKEVSSKDFIKERYVFMGYLPRKTAELLKGWNADLYKVEIAQLTGGGDLNRGVNLEVQYETSC